MTHTDFEQRAWQLLPCLREAGNRIMEMREKPDFQVMKKSDGSPVSNADLWANDYFTDILRQYYPGEPIVGEESESKKYPVGAERLWFLDPIDGTTHFVSGKDNFFILIGLCIDGIPSFGLSYQPTTGILIAGDVQSGVRMIDRKDQITPLQAPDWPDEQPSLILKRPPPELKERLWEEFRVKRYPYIDEQVDMLGPLLDQSNGFVSYRETALWDLCAPAAIMHSAGYEILRRPDGTVELFNQGNLIFNFFYSLPANTPAGLRKRLIADSR